MSRSKPSFYSVGLSGPHIMQEESHQLQRINCPPLEDAVFFSCGNNFCVFYHPTKGFLGGGVNDNLVLGKGHKFITPFSCLAGFRNIVPRYFTCGDKTLLIINTEGHLYVSGVKNEVFRIKEFSPLSYVSAGLEGCIAIPEEHDGIYLYKFHSSIKPELLLTEKKFIDCAAGRKQYIAIDNEAMVYIWYHKHTSTTEPFFVSYIVQELKGSVPRRVFAQFGQFAILDKDNKLWISGNNDHGQLGTGDFIHSNENFIFIPGVNDIVQVAFSQQSTYLLDSKGSLYYAGIGEFLGENYLSATFQKTNIQNITFMATGEFLIILAENFKPEFVHSPLSQKISFNHPTIFKMIQFKDETKPTEIDISDYAFSYLGFARNSIIESQEEGTIQIIGLVNPLIVAARKLDGDPQYIKIRIVSPIQLHIKPLFFESSHQNDDDYVYSNIRPGLLLKFNITPQECAPFGFQAGERVCHESYGCGNVLGVFCGLLWFIWDRDNGLASQGSRDILSMHDSIEILQSNRVVQQCEFNDMLINIEIAPCHILSQYNFCVGDIVIGANSKLGEIKGQFCHQCVVHDFLENKNYFALPNNLKLVRRDSSYCQTPAIIQHLAFNGSVVDIDVSFNQNDYLIPLDRIITSKGFATCIGKSNSNEPGYWILTDDAFVLNLGVVFLHDISTTALIRRLSENFDTCNDFIISYSPYDKLDVYPGDIICKTNDKNERINYLIIGLDLEMNPVCFSLKDKCIMQNIIGKNETPVIIYRAGIDASCTIKDSTNFVFLLKSSLEHFQGLGIKPGDKVEFEDGEKAIVLGRMKESICFLSKSRNTVINLPIKDILENQLYRIVKRMGIGIISPC